jgi:hypothetical protein
MRGEWPFVPAFAAPWTTCWAHAPARYRGTFLALVAHERVMQARVSPVSVDTQAETDWSAPLGPDRLRLGI